MTKFYSIFLSIKIDRLFFKVYLLSLFLFNKFISMPRTRNQIKKEEEAIKVQQEILDGANALIYLSNSILPNASKKN